MLYALVICFSDINSSIINEVLWPQAGHSSWLGV